MVVNLKDVFKNQNVHKNNDVAHFKPKDVSNTEMLMFNFGNKTGEI